jgi:hypothetical protein
LGTVSIELRRWRDPGERVVIGRGGFARGPAGGRLARSLFARRERSEDFRHFTRTYAPFRAPVAEGELIFQGRGKVRAGPDERRMIAEWARGVAAEGIGGGLAASYGLVMAWHRSGAVGNCDEVSVYLTGEVVARSCSWEEEIRGRLETAQLGRVYAWFDRLGPFQRGGQEEEARPGSTQSRLIFAGRGRQEAAARGMEEIEAFTLALHRELAGRRPNPRPEPPPAAKEEGARTPATPAPPPQRLLLPPRPAAPTGPRPGQEIVLVFPEEPPLKEEPPPPAQEKKGLQGQQGQQGRQGQEGRN